MATSRYDIHDISDISKPGTAAKELRAILSGCDVPICTKMSGSAKFEISGGGLGGLGGRLLKAMLRFAPKCSSFTFFRVTHGGLGGLRTFEHDQLAKQSHLAKLD